ncbi:MAG: DUF6602 domain-containing protein [Gemmataceae bacterium]
MATTVEVPFVVNKYLEARLAGIRKSMLASFAAGMDLSAATKGNEREVFVKSFLTQVFSPAYRFGTGDITSSDNMRSGQVDIVVESPYWYSLPVHPEGPRLYVVEGVAAVIEIKSNLMSQWDEILATAEKVKQLRRRNRLTLLKDLAETLRIVNDHAKATGEQTSDEMQKSIDSVQGALQQLMSKSPTIRPDIPCYCVGYSGWKTVEAFDERFDAATDLDGALLLDPPVYRFRSRDNGRVEGLAGDWALATFLDQIASDITTVAQMELPTAANYMSGLIPATAASVYQQNQTAGGSE